MTANQNLLAALTTLEEKLKHLQHLSEANHFMVEVLQGQADDLKQMDAAPARAMMRAQARQKFGAEAPAGNSEVLDILEKALGADQSAEIIPFPNGRA